MESKQIVENLKARKKELEAELARVERALNALADAPAPKKPKAATAPANGSANDVPDVTQESVLSVLTSEPRTAKAIAFSRGWNASKVSVVLSALASSGRCVRAGEKGSYTYAALVAQNVAEA